MIKIRFVREYVYQDGTTGSDTYELEVDQPYNPTVMRDMRDCVMSMLPEAGDQVAELSEFEESDDGDADT